LPIIYPLGLSREIQFVLAAVVMVINLGVYGWLFQRWRRSRAAGEGVGEQKTCVR
jgi:hypothetical protein